MTLPEAVTAPTPGLMLTEVAFEVVHVSVEDWPELMLAGDAENVAVGDEPTVIVTLSVTLPEELVAVMVYVVVAAGDTAREPLAATVPMP